MEMWSLSDKYRDAVGRHFIDQHGRVVATYRQHTMCQGCIYSKPKSPIQRIYRGDTTRCTIRQNGPLGIREEIPSCGINDIVFREVTSDE